MLGLLIILGFGVWILLYHPPLSQKSSKSGKISERFNSLWKVAQVSLREKKYLRAEKALLTILRFDERNATAYNRLGIIYAKQKAYNDAIECFEIAQSLEPNASSLHNVGLIYYETEQYDKAALAFAQALHIEDTVASRHIAYAKVQEKFGDMEKAINSLERAVALERNPQSLRILADAYERVGRTHEANSLKLEAEKIVLPKGAAQRIKQPRKVVM
jgi:tetratricopeptide (TPR) repeat protein